MNEVARLASDIAFGRFVTVIAINRANKLRQLVHTDPGHMSGPRLGLEQVAKMRGWIPVGSPLRDREAIDLADMLLETATDVERTACLDTAHNRGHLGAGNDTKVNLAEGGKRIPLEPGQKPRGVALSSDPSLLVCQSARGLLEGRDDGWLILGT